MGNSAPAVHSQQIFKSTFKAFINKYYSIAIDIERYQGVLEHALSKVHFLVGMGIYMLPSDLSLNTGKMKGYNNKTLLTSRDMKIGSKRCINKDHKKIPSPVPGKAKNVAYEKVMIMKSTDEPVKDRLVTQDEILKMFAEQHSDGKIAITFLIVGAGLIAYHFW